MDHWCVVYWSCIIRTVSIQLAMISLQKKDCTRLLKIHHVIFNFTVTIIFSFQCLKTIKNKYTLCYKTFPVSQIIKNKDIYQQYWLHEGKNTGGVEYVWYNGIRWLVNVTLSCLIVAAKCIRVGIIFTLNSDDSEN